MNSLQAISPVDGRYRSKVEPLAAYFSEEALMRYRVRVEVEYYIALNEVLHFAPQKGWQESLRDVYRTFGSAEGEEIKEIERTTNHDVKAVEYFLKRRLDALGLSACKEMAHFGLTSQDVNNTSVPLSMKDCHEQVLLPRLEHLVEQIAVRAEEWRRVPMLAHTHGQPASPTTLGKELMVTVYRLQQQMKELRGWQFGAKFGGATGAMNAHKVAYPEVDWPHFANQFVEQRLGLHRQQLTTQIENYDQMAAYFDSVKRINVILTDFSRDIWMYVSMEYFKQQIKAGEVGSSAMPHKVNPIDFENAEGNLGMANAIFEHLSHKLPISRLQRDLTDSTVSRNIGVPIAHTLIAIASLEKGLGKLLLNEAALKEDLEANWAVVAEGIQTVLRSVGYPNPYEALKQLTRKNEKITQQGIADFIDSLDVTEDVKQRLRAIRPDNYYGYADQF